MYVFIYIIYFFINLLANPQTYLGHCEASNEQPHPLIVRLLSI